MSETDEAENEAVEEPQSEPDSPVERKQRQARYVVVAQPRQIFRLHRSDGCWMGREKVFKSSVEYEARPGPESYTHVCRLCWPGGEREAGGEESEDGFSVSSPGSGDGDPSEGRGGRRR